MPKLVFLATDLALYGLVAVIAFYIWHALRTPTLRQTWRSVLHDAAAMSAGVVLMLFLVIAMLDSFHFRPLLPAAPGAAADAAPAYSTRTLSGARRVAGRAARIAREDLLGAARNPPVLEGVDAGRRQVGPRLPAPAIRRRASQGPGRRMARAMSSHGPSPDCWAARSPRRCCGLSSRRCARDRRRPAWPRRCARSGTGPPKFRGGRCC